MKLKRKGIHRGSAPQSEIENLIADLMENGTGGDRSKWKKAFKVLSKDKRLMKKVLEIDSTRAFEKYYELGEDRSLASLSRATGHETNKLARWRRKYQWERQIAERDNLVYDALKMKAVSSVVLVKLEYSGMINKAIRDALTNIEEYNKRVAAVNAKTKDPKKMMSYKSLIYTADDFEKLVKLDMLMRGDVTDRKEVTTVADRERILEDQIANDEETKQLLDNLYKRTRLYNTAIKKLPPADRGKAKTIDITDESSTN